MKAVSFTCFILTCFSFFGHSRPYRILGVFPHMGFSHFKVFEPIMLELANRGHEVVVISRFPRSVKSKNYVDIDVNSLAPDYNNKIPFFAFDRIPVSLSVDLEALFRYMIETEEILKTENFKKFYKSKPKFDLMIMENFNTRLFLALAYKLNVPFITLSSCVLFPQTSYEVANPINPSYIPNILSYYSNKMSFFERLDNFYSFMVTSLAVEFIFNPKAEKLKEKYFGKDVPPLWDLAKNSSLIIVNSHFTLNGPRPLVPTVIEVGGLFVKPAEVLPKDIEKFLNDSTDGVIYFCMGSLLRGETFPEVKRNAFLKAFLKIPQRVLWKWEGDVLPGKSDKIMISKWMPQRDILANPKVKLFISHGGLLGTSEAVYEGVPVLGIPIFGDQRTNIKSLEASGAAELLDYNDISEEVVLEKIQRLVNDPKYKQNAQELSARYRDRPMSPLDTAVYWTEYVIRHNGAYHLKTAAVDMPWYQYLLLDVIAFLIFVLVTVIVVLYYSAKYSLRFICNLLCNKKSIPIKGKKEKHN